MFGYQEEVKDRKNNNLFDFNKETVKQIMKNADMPEGEFENLINKFQDRILDDVKELSVVFPFSV